VDRSLNGIKRNDMDTQERINKIIKERYHNYEGHANQTLKLLHDHMRSITYPLTIVERFLKLIGFDIKYETVMTNEDFLEYLLKQERENPRPVYEPPQFVKDLM